MTWQQTTNDLTHDGPIDRSIYESPGFCGLRVNTLRPRQDGRHFADDIFKCIFLNKNVWIPIKNSLQFVHKGSINNIPTLVHIIAWRHSGDKPLSEPMMVSSLTHICVTQPQAGLKMHICISDLCHRCFRWWFGTSSTPSHYLKQCWDWRKFNRPFAEIPQYTSPISHNASFVTEMCTCVHISVTKCCIVV